MSGGTEFFSGSGRVTLQQDDSSGIAMVTLDNPGKKNALSGSMMAEIEKIIQNLEQWSSGKAVILSGHGGDFCTGVDLDLVRNILHAEGGQRMSSYLQDLMTRFSNLPLISVAMISGIAVGGGAELTTACDFRLMTPRAKIGFVQIKMGVVTGFGGGTRLTRIIGRSQAIRVLCSGKVYRAEESKAIGLVDDILPGERDSVEEAKEWIQENFPHDTEMTRNMKRIIIGASDLDSGCSLLNERGIFVSTWGQPLHLDAVNSNIKHRE